MLTLYYSPRACSLVSHIALEEVGADYQAIRLDMAANAQKSADYLAINPKARVPALVTPRGVLTETPAILAYLAQTFPQARMGSDDAYDMAQINAFNVYLASSVHVAFAHAFRPSRFVEDQAAIAAIAAEAPAKAGAYLAPIDTLFADGRPWVHGETYSISDPYLFVMTRWLAREGMGDPDRFAGLTAHRQRMNDRPAVRQVLAREEQPIF